MEIKNPEIISFEKIGSSELGYITIAEVQKNIPFEIKRVYWTYFTPQDVIRGGHAHKALEQIIFAVSGTITFNTEDQHGNKQTFVLDHPSKGLFIPNLIWRDIHFTHNAVLLCLASEPYDEKDYFRNFQDFKNYLFLNFVEYNQKFLDLSWEWLNDPDIKYLTETPDFSRENQLKWFNSLENNENYFIKGIELKSMPIGVVGLKNIDFSSKKAEYFGYIGEKEFWNKGLSVQIFNFIFFHAKNVLNLNELYLNVINDNLRAIKSYQKAGFKIVDDQNSRILMLKELTDEF